MFVSESQGEKKAKTSQGKKKKKIAFVFLREEKKEGIPQEEKKKAAPQDEKKVVTSPGEKKLSAAERKALDCPRFFIFGRQISCAHCLWRRLDMCSEAKTVLEKVG